MAMTSASEAYFQRVAGEWDQIRSGYFGEGVRASAIAKAYLRPEMAVADIGAGTGFLTAGLAPQVMRVFAVDGSEAMLMEAKKNLKGVRNVEFHHADGLTLPFPDESLDAVFANMYLHHCPDPQAAIDEMTRVLVPGGRLVLTDMDAHPYAWLKEELADTWQGFERPQLREWFAEAGLVNVIVDCSGESCCAVSAKAETPVENEACEAAAQSTQAVGKANISIFIAVGTKRVPMRRQVLTAYSRAARGEGAAKSCACGHDSAGESSAESCACGGGGTCGCGGGGSCGCGGSQPDLEESLEMGQESGGQSCCGGQSTPAPSEHFEAIYAGEELLNVPAEAREFGLGCGNPLALANLRAGEVVLDIGSGGGLDSFLAARKVGPTGHVIGVDMTPAMLRRARQAAERAGISNVEFRKGQAEELPVENDAVDVILSNCVINLCEDKGQVFREAFRVLRGNGRLEVSDMVSSGGLPMYVRLDAGEWAECVSGALPEGEYVDLIRQAGFTDIQVHRSLISEQAGDVTVYSAIVSAVKPGN